MCWQGYGTVPPQHPACQMQTGLELLYLGQPSWERKKKHYKNTNRQPNQCCVSVSSLLPRLWLLREHSATAPQQSKPPSRLNPYKYDPDPCWNWSLPCNHLPSPTQSPKQLLAPKLSPSIYRLLVLPSLCFDSPLPTIALTPQTPYCPIAVKQMSCLSKTHIVACRPMEGSGTIVSFAVANTERQTCPTFLNK